MIRIVPANELLLFEYTPDAGPNWVKGALRDKGQFTLRRTFTFEPKDLYDAQARQELMDESEEWEEYEEPEDYDPFDQDEVVFILGRKVDDYYQIEKGKVTHVQDVYLYQSVKMDIKLFVSARNISVFSKLERFVNGPIFVGGDAVNAVPEHVFLDLIKQFPNSRQKDLYEGAVITSILRDYVDGVPDYRRKFENYLNKRATVVPSDLKGLLKDLEVHKFQLILEKLELMLADQNSYNEHQWQEEILTMITLIYPKYVHAFKSVALKRKDQTDLQVDLLLVDSGGYVDIIEIKKPSDSIIITQATYRDNHIPYRELTGTVMQIEKYIYHLNRWGADGERYLTQKLSGLPPEFEVKLTNPGGLVIMGRDNNMSVAQLKDFEVVKRKYRNIMDIITYDELLRRLRFTVKMWSE